ncbi:MAG: lamin tail domain-containing protein [Myxococcota bacterium]|nr:lamin tail domain-containing protein [Myxococcota bacterium]
MAVALAGFAGCDLLVPQEHVCRVGQCSKEEARDAGPTPDAGTDAGVVFVEPDAGTYLKVVTWNVLWFGSTNPEFGLADDDLQQVNIRTVLGRIGADIYGLQEVVDPARLTALVGQLPGYAGFTANEAGGGYSADEAKPAFVYRTSTVEVLARSTISELNNYDFAYRPPLRVDLRITKAGATRELTVLVVHLKASGAVEDWQRRANSSVQLKAWLDTQLPAQDVLVIGDFNDDLDQSYVSGKPSPFANFVADPANYRFATQVLTDENIPTTTDYSTPIDHQLMSNELEYRLLPGSVQVIRPDQWIASYRSTTSDHFPVVAQYLMATDSTGTIQLTAPDGGQSFSGGQPTEVQWIATGMEEVRVDFSPDGGNWRSIGSAAADAGTLGVILPNVEATAARFRVSNAHNPAVFDLGPAPLAIVRSPDTVFMNELRYDEPGEDFDNEFVELVNGGAVAVNLAGWTLHDSDAARYTFVPGTTLAPGKALVVFGSVSAASASGTPNAIGSGSRLNLHPADSVILKDPFGVVVDSFSWTTSPGDAVSVNRDPDAEGTGAWVSHQDLAGTFSSPGRRADGSDF